MADNKTLDGSDGLGATIATDEIAGVDYQRVKVNFGADGSSTDASSANPLPVVQTGALPAGTNAIGKLVANSGVDIGDVDVTSSALPTGAATAAKQPALGTAGVASADVITVQGVASMTAIKTDPSAVTSPVSVASLPLPTGAATAAKQPALGTAGTASADVITVQGKASMTPLLVDPSGVTSPVSLASVPSHAVTNAGTFAVQIATNSSVNQAQIAGTATDVNSGTKSAGTQRVVLATDQPQLTNALKVDGSAVTQPVSGTVTASVGAATSGGCSPFKLISAASTNSTNVKSSAGQVYAIVVVNINAAVRYLKLYDKATAPTVGTDTPVWTVPVPGNTAGAGVSIPLPVGMAFSSGIGVGLTTGSADSDTGAVAAGEQVVNIAYK